VFAAVKVPTYVRTIREKYTVVCGVVYMKKKWVLVQMIGFINTSLYRHFKYRQ
jgi:hypothetical protein